jgi:hypothetical protein
LLDAPTALAACCGFDQCHKYICLHLYLYSTTQWLPTWIVCFTDSTSSRWSQPGHCHVRSSRGLPSARVLRRSNPRVQAPGKGRPSIRCAEHIVLHPGGYSPHRTVAPPSAPYHTVTMAHSHTEERGAMMSGYMMPSFTPKTMEFRHASVYPPSSGLTPPSG